MSRYSILGVHFIIYIELTFVDSRAKLHSSFVETLHGDNFKRPFLQNWKFFIIVVKQWDDENTHSVIAILQATFKRVKYSYIVNAIQKSLSVPWTVRFNNETYKLFANLNKHVVYFESEVLILFMFYYFFGFIFCRSLVRVFNHLLQIKYKQVFDLDLTNCVLGDIKITLHSSIEHVDCRRLRQKYTQENYHTRNSLGDKNNTVSHIKS